MVTGLKRSVTVKNEINPWGVSVAQLTAEVALNRLKDWLDKNEIQPKEAAKATGMDADKFERLLNGEETFLLPTLFALQGYFGLNIRYIIYGEQPETLTEIKPLILDEQSEHKK